MWCGDPKGRNYVLSWGQLGTQESEQTRVLEGGLSPLFIEQLEEAGGQLKETVLNTASHMGSPNQNHNEIPEHSTQWGEYEGIRILIHCR